MQHVRGIEIAIRAIRQRIVEFPEKRAGAGPLQDAEILEPILQGHGIEQLAVVDDCVRVPAGQKLAGEGQEFR